MSYHERMPTPCFARTAPVLALAAAMVGLMTPAASAQPVPGSPWVYDAGDASKSKTPRRKATGLEIGTLTMMTGASRSAVLARIDGSRVYELDVRYFIGIPSWYGVDDLPPIVARGVVIDVVGQKGVARLADDYRITRADLEAALTAQRTTLQPGDIVFIKGGKITLEATEWLAEGQGAMLIGGDELSLELYKVGRPDLTVPVHNYLINQRGLAILQVENLDVLVADKVYEFAFIAAPLRASGGVVQFRPLAFPLK